MSSLVRESARAVADTEHGLILATIHLAAAPERVFRAIVSDEVTRWWVRPGVFDTREFDADVRVGGRWRATGIGNGSPFALGGEFLHVNPPRELVHSWRVVGVAGEPTTVSYRLEPTEHGTRLVLRHEGFTSPEVCERTAASWETSFDRLAEMLASE